jgi:hypothetical protein
MAVVERFHRKEDQMKRHLYQTACALTVCGLVGVSGCAGKEKVLTEEQISNTEKAVGAARDGNASVNAPLELRLAEEKLQAAKAAADKKEYDQARDLLEEAQVDADLATAKSGSVKAQQVAKEMRDNINALRKEIERAETAQ